MGSPFYPLSEQIKDTAMIHGLDWAEWHYCHSRNGPKLSAREWDILSRPAQKVAQKVAPMHV